MKDFVKDLKVDCVFSENPAFEGEYAQWHICRANTLVWLRNFKPDFVRDILLSRFKEDGFYCAGYFPEDMDAIVGLIQNHIEDGIITSKGGEIVIETDDFVFVINNSVEYYKRIIILSNEPF